MQLKILFIGNYHAVNDTRLLHREIDLIHKNVDAPKTYFVKAVPQEHDRVVTSRISKYRYKNNEIIYIQFRHPKYKKYSFFKRFFYKIVFLFWFLKIVKIINPDIVQASDAKEIFIGYLAKKRSKALSIYDSHEDYFRQVFDYCKNIFIKIIYSSFIFMIELLYVRTYDYVFCVDEYLLEKYKKRMYNAKKVGLLRCFPHAFRTSLYDDPKRFEEKNELHLVYVGNINTFRGVIECSEYVARYNSEKNGKRLHFHIYSNKHRIVDHLVTHQLIIHHSSIDYPDLIKDLELYDVGICLWLPIKKYHRNLPMKNFDYMGAGLPIITSNFGNLKKYMDLSQSGICINPLSYDEFKNAINRLFDPKERIIFSNNGINFVRGQNNFENESKEYIKAIKEHAKRLNR